MTTGPQFESSEAKSRADLLRRLEEAEETLRAIREGEVDALVVQSDRSDEVFTLQGGDDSYRVFMETMDHGAAALGSKGEILYANKVLCDLLAFRLPEHEGKVLATLFAENVGKQIERLLSASVHGKQSIELSSIGHEEARHYLISAAPLSIGLVSGWALTFTDLTDRLNAEKSLASERAARAIIASANEAVVVCDPDGRITHVNAAVFAIQEGQLLGRLFHDAIKLTFSDTGLLQSENLIELAMSGTPVQGIEAHAPNAPRARDLLISAAPLSLSGEKISGCVVTMVDLSHRKAAERQQLLLMAELDHRVKNTLALVLSILRRSTEGTIEDFKEAFSGRIHALAATHNLLAKKSWANLTLAEIVSAELSPYLQMPNPRISMDGLDAGVAPRAAIALGLIFHELTTNAVKYGSLSVEEGRLALSATVNDERNRMTVDWVETSGPPVEEPQRKGFGHTVITRSLGYSPNGGAQLEFSPSGVRCTISVPPEDLIPRSLPSSHKY